MSGDDFAIDAAIRSSYAKGRNAGLEEGARVAFEEERLCWLQAETSEKNDMRELLIARANTAAEIAAAIRSLKDKL